MKRIFTFLCAALMTLSAVKAEVLFNEKFDSRATGDLNSGEYSTSMTADGKWYNSLGSTYIQVAEQQLTYTNYCVSTTGKAAKFTANHGKDFTGFTKTANSGTVYMAFLLKVNSLKTTSSAQGATNLIASMWSSLSSNAAGYMFGQVKIKTVDANTYNLGIAKRTETAVFADNALSTGETYLVVTEYIFSNEVDVVNLYINPAKENPTISKAANLTPTGAQTDATAIVGAVLASNGNTPDDMLIDEIKVVTSWADLWEGGSNTPTIQANPTSVYAGYVRPNKAYQKSIVIKGSKLKGAISIASNNEAVTFSPSSISKTEAESENGKGLMISITAPAAGAGNAKVTLSSEDAADVEISINWTGVTPYENIAALSAPSEDSTFVLNSSPIVIRKIDDTDLIIQDASGAYVLAAYKPEHIEGINEGDILYDVMGGISAEEGYHLGFPTAFTFEKPYVASTGNIPAPLAVTLDNITKYGPALVKASGVSFAESGQFAAKNYTISQESNDALMKVPAGCDIIGLDIPAKANVTGLVNKPLSTAYIEIRSKADVVSGPTGIGEVRSETTDVVRSEKKIINGQLVIVKGSKMYNVIGVEL